MSCGRPAKPLSYQEKAKIEERINQTLKESGLGDKDDNFWYSLTCQYFVTVVALVSYNLIS